MRQVMRKGLITVAAASGVLAVTGYAHADSGADGSTERSPGVGSGNSVQAPIEVPVNVCGTTVNVVGLLNPATGNSCVNESDGGSSGPGSGSGASADGSTSNSPGVISGNNVQAPISAPVNACGISVTGVSALSPATGNSCGTDAGEVTPPGEVEPPGEDTEQVPPKQPGDDIVDEEEVPADPNEPKTQLVTTGGSERLAQTGSDLPLGVAVPVSAGLLLAGTVLYRRARQRA